MERGARISSKYIKAKDKNEEERSSIATTDISLNDDKSRAERRFQVRDYQKKTENPANNKTVFDRSASKDLKKQQLSVDKKRNSDIVSNRLSDKQGNVALSTIDEQTPNKLPSVNTTRKKKDEEETEGTIRGYIPFVTDVDTWLKRNKLAPDTKVFIISNGYNSIKNALLKRNWVENPNNESSCFHLKYTLKTKDLNYDSQYDYQIVNHFSRANNITTKVGIMNTLKNSTWFCSQDHDEWFPRCYDSSCDQSYGEFVIYYKQLRTEAYIKQFIGYCSESNLNRESDEYIGKLDKQKVAINISQRRLYHFGEFLADAKCPQDLISENEWEMFAGDDKSEADIMKMVHQSNMDRYSKLNKGDGIKKKKKKKKKKVSVKDAKADNDKEDIVRKEDSKPLDKDDQYENRSQIDEEDLPDPKIPEIEQEAYDTQQQLRENLPQTDMNGFNNVWIVKPAALSRGRGIKLFGSQAEINHLIKNKETGWIIQKYMECPALIGERKFDIRQWVMVCDWNPQTIWFYEECYIRFSGHKFSLDNQKDRYAHQTNNSVNKNAEDYNGLEMFWEMNQLESYLLEEKGYDHYNEVIKPRMKDIVKYSLQSSQDLIDNRKNSSEIYGYDFCLDDNFEPWLIEINSSPAFDFSSVSFFWFKKKDITEKLVKAASEDYVKVVVDYNMCTKKKAKKKINTGDFTLIHKSKVSFFLCENCCRVN